MAVLRTRAFCTKVTEGEYAMFKREANGVPQSISLATSVSRMFTVNSVTYLSGCPTPDTARCERYCRAAAIRT
jgi:hypothetical protein